MKREDSIARTSKEIFAYLTFPSGFLDAWPYISSRPTRNWAGRPPRLAAFQG